MPFLMFVLNFPFLLAGYLLKVLVFGLRGFWKPYLQGAKEAARAIPPSKKAEVPPAQCALLCVNRAVAGCRCVPLYRLPRRPCAEMEIAPGPAQKTAKGGVYKGTRRLCS